MKKQSTYSDSETKKLAHDVAREFNGGEILALSGDLGAGKTTFTQGIAEYFGITEHVSSPTFALIQEYSVSSVKGQKSGVRRLIHIDCYRLSSPQELVDIGIEEYFDRDDVVILIEWAEKVKDILPERTQWIVFEHGEKENERHMNLFEIR